MKDNKKKEIKKKNINRVKSGTSQAKSALKEDFDRFKKMDFERYEKYELEKMNSDIPSMADLKKEAREKEQFGKLKGHSGKSQGQYGKSQGHSGKSQEQHKNAMGNRQALEPDRKNSSATWKADAVKKKGFEAKQGKVSRFGDDFSDYEDFTPEQKKAIGKEKQDKFGDRHSSERSNRFKHDKNDKNVKDGARKIKTACPYLRECGGCNILQKSYEAELKDKQKMVEDLIKGFCKVEPIIGMKNPKNYRNKVHVVFDHDRKGNPISGVYEEGTHRVIAIDQCLIHNQKADEIIASIRGMLKSFKIKTYDEDTGYGLLRHVMVRTGFTSGEIMVVLVLASPIMPSKNNFVKALRKLHPEITTVVINVNDKDTSMVLGEKEQVIYGKGYIEDTLCGKVFRISSKSFYQVNPVQTEILYGKAIEFAGLSGKETVVDAYCGIGTIGIIASDKAKKVIGVELNKDAVKDAVTNAKRNSAGNIEFYQNDASDFMVQMAQKGEKVDVVFMDPPRAGSTEKFIDAVAVLQPSKVVYVSCNPVTLERDLKYFKKKGYQAKKAVPVDMFAWTGHVETVIKLERQ